MAHLRRLQTNDLEIGATEAVQRHYARHVVASKPVSQRKLDFEARRPRWLRECLAEATGVFFYGSCACRPNKSDKPVYPGIAATASTFLNATPGTQGQLLNPTFGSLLQIGFAYALGIAFAIITCASTSGG